MLEDPDLQAEFSDFTNAVFTANFLSRLEVSFLARDREDWLAATINAPCPG